MTDAIAVIVHNMRGYDTHLIVWQIGQIAKNHTHTNKKGEEQLKNMNAIPNDVEKYMDFMLCNHFTFIDSFQFMSLRLHLHLLIDNALAPSQC